MTRADDTANERPPGRPERQRDQGDEPTPASPDADSNLPPRIGYIGKRLGRFHIMAELGRGGMATVYRAHDPTVGRDVAVKVMHGFFAGRADIEARFRREANAVAAIRHPSILALYDFTPPVGEEPGYIVSELIEGPGLRTLAEERGGRVLPEVAVAIATRIAEALGAAHAAGIVHRDVKPDNVLIDRAGGRVRVVLTDFGVAHVGSMDTMTATGAVLGSPAFMSPEQARGDDVGPPSDVFSLGVLLYQLLTGHLPFSGKDPLALITAILRGEYIRPGKLESRVGPDLEQVVVRSLQRDPAARFLDGRAVALALRETLASVGFPDEEVLLRQAVPDLDAFARSAAPDIADRAVAAAEQARKRRQIPRALAEVGRAIAYVPEHAAARAMLDRLGARRRSPWVIAAVAAVVVGAVAAVGVGVFRRAPDAPSLTATASITREPRPAVVVPPVATTVLPPSTPTQAEVPTAAAATPRPNGPAVRARPRPSRSNGPTATRVPSAPAVAPEESAAAVEIVEPAVEQPPPQPPVVPTPVPTGSIIIRVSKLFCEPSLDDAPPSLRVSTYNNLAPGNHDIYCTLPQGGGKKKVATYNLRAGTRPTLTIVQAPDDGHPILARPE